ncbi:group II intron reverse transcriptase/maturase [Frankia sp. R82]|uniref:group II intron reverse transcriptase/maturase n=1 Tax=Frankia sp. R82 TaxID=2950553 RepID=UPI002043EA55|nr:group II intron reverse transcriptase/maturase [Frankia sp. R82]MCM3886522.1 group II intron reverse transcriptase/maturase [Frankia sp. R82]
MELKGTLDTRPPSGPVNGPEDGLRWQEIDWSAAEENVRRLRQRIFAASQAGDLKKVRNLQKLMLRCRSNTLVSVRRVTEINAGRRTAGVDGQVVLTPGAKADLATWVQHQSASWKPKPVRRVHIPKGKRKRRPLGIPVIVDRVLQSRTVNALEPEWEARFEPKSYGFRPGRGCQDAIQAVFRVAHGKNPRRPWVLDADLTAAFDCIDHDHLMEMLGGFPGRRMISGWLKSGAVENELFTATPEGTPQGGTISPLLLNIALHGMESAAGVRYFTAGSHAGETRAGSPILIRYADDLLVFTHTQEESAQVQARLAAWLEPRGLVFNAEKTRIVHLREGCDFLGFNVRRYRDGTLLLIRPSADAVRRLRKRLAAEMKALRGANAAAVIRRLNPIIRGWAAYYRGVVSSRTFHGLDAYMWKLVYKWAVHTHPNKSKRWITARYFGMFNKSRRDRWVFGDRESGHYLTKFSWTRIVRHHLVKGNASVDDPTLTGYWVGRRRRHGPAILHARDSIGFA